MQLLGGWFIHNSSILVFANFRVDQNFINPYVVAHLGMDINSSSSETVMVATGQYFRTRGMAHKVSVWL